jgi:lysozyme
MVARLVEVPVTENQFSALVSICQNIGSGNFQKSTFRMKLNRKDYFGCAKNLWLYRRANGPILAGLVLRRESERKLFLTP